MRFACSILFFTLTTPVLAGSEVYSFKNPTFGDDPAAWSSQQLALMQMENAAKAQILSDKKAAESAELAAKNNTNIAKFLNNLESRIYAQLSLQLSNAMFSSGATTGTLDFQGTTISWIKDNVAQTITLTIIDTTGNKTDIVVPIGSFAF